MNYGFTKLQAYLVAEDLAHDIFEVTKHFPRNEDRSLTDQIRRSSRSVCSNLAEGYAKRRYPRHFISKLTDSLGESYETETWLRFARKCEYIDNDTYNRLHIKSESVTKLVLFMIRNPTKFEDKYVDNKPTRAR
ncbi:four helix bundle protein [Neolewinella antarctica]|uniref:Four helix bundle protein n=1 Tax=Neolewinella antarctica TaxID=442734 RepID=A0ABX0XC15_9BACT|nr:four helix bundle protein [Neolewinella antarctica]NJC26805.1 four helix bundle protein [Neolewinella antarctica]